MESGRMVKTLVLLRAWVAEAQKIADPDVKAILDMCAGRISVHTLPRKGRQQRDHS